MSTDPLAEIRDGFFAECEELLETLQDALAALRPDAPDQETINTVFRAVHSIKGGAGAFGLEALVGFAHRFESVLDALRSGRLALTEAALKHFVHAADVLDDHVKAARDDAPPPEESEPCLAALERLGVAPEATEFTFQPVMLDLDAFDPPPECRWRVRFHPAAGLYASGNEPLYLLRALRALGGVPACDLPGDAAFADFDPEKPRLGWCITLPGELPEADIREVFDFVEDLCTLDIARDGAPDPAPLPVPVAPLPEEPSAAPVPTPLDHGTTVRVDLERVDRLVNLVGELVINQAMLAQSAAESGMAPNSAVMTGLEAFTALTREIQESVMMIRAQPVKPLFQRMARIVREVSASTGKEVRLTTTGEATEVDKTVIERLSEPLTHMIRNAIDHGIETPDVRIARGKPATGTIQLSAQHRSGRLIVELADDGAGINREKVLQTAIQRGLIAPDSHPGESEIDKMLFLPGFSTAAQVSAVSGRGVGMDVVRSAIHALGGRVSISSAPHEGTRFSISLPLTLAVLDGMVVRVAGETLVVPISAILETATLTPEEVRPIGGGLHVLHLRGAFLPLFDLGSELGFRAPKRFDEGGVVLLTTHDNGTRSALIVDSIVDQRQVVIKGLHRSYGRISGIAAATILGDGRVALIVDPTDLLARPGGSSHNMAMAG